MLATTPVVAACGNGVGSTKGTEIDARADATINHLYTRYPATREIGEKSTGVLIMPLVTEAGLGLGGGYGRGAMRINGATVDYYAMTKLSTGLQIGAQQYAHVLFFMTEPALREFRSSPGWAAGAGLEYVISDKGDSVSADTTTVMAPVLAAVFGRAGLRIGATLEGTKYTRIIP